MYGSGIGRMTEVARHGGARRSILRLDGVHGAFIGGSLFPPSWLTRPPPPSPCPRQSNGCGERWVLDLAGWTACTTASVTRQVANLTILASSGSLDRVSNAVYYRVSKKHRLVTRGCYCVVAWRCGESA